jgi:GNAT superfamily N-acetyltransferase
MDVHDMGPSEIEAARRLLEACGWRHRVSDPAQFRELLSRSQRCLAERHRRRGIGRALVKAVMGEDPGMTWVLRAGREGISGFYEKLGFVRSRVAMERPRSARTGT